MAIFSPPVQHRIGRNSAGRGLVGTKWWARQDLNLGPTDYESAALTAELRALRHSRLNLISICDQW